jgi:hypothetical protein
MTERGRARSYMSWRQRRLNAKQMGVDRNPRHQKG